MSDLTTSIKHFASLNRAPGPTWTDATYLRRHALGAKLDDGLFRVMQSGKGREALREAILQSCFSAVATIGRYPNEVVRFLNTKRTQNAAA